MEASIQQTSLTNKEVKQHQLKKHVNAIHCTNNFTLVQRKLFNALLFHAYHDLPKASQFRIPTKQLCQLIGYNSHDYKSLKKSLLGLMQIVIEWNIIDITTGKEKHWKASAILASAELHSGYCSYEYSQVMKTFLYQPDIYGRLDMDLIAQFKSSYGLALYENCIRYQNIPQTPWFPIDVFRKLMGVSEKKYIAFKDFKKRVIDGAIREVNAVAPIHITLEVDTRFYKNARNVRFKIGPITCQHNQTMVVETDDKELILQLSDTFGLSQTTIITLLKEYDVHYIREKVYVILASDNFQKGNIRSLSGYLMQALKQDYQTSKSSHNVINKVREEKELAEIKMIEREQNNQKQYECYVNDHIEQVFSELSEKEKDKCRSLFKQHIHQEGGYLARWYKEYGRDHPAVRSQFKKFLQASAYIKPNQLMSYEGFIENN
ncbi:MAG: replication initiation protein [Gammaproteobacteria bacterium]|nr:replication initiation protein [Gammaproteobacteria bacterium]